LIEIENNVPISIAAEEIVQGEITYRRPLAEQSGATLED